MTWKPHVTVAAIIEDHNQFLMVEEIIDGKKLINQPAGHLEANESLVDAVIRETREETTRDFQAEFLVGVYQWTHPDQTAFLRFTFAGSCGPADKTRKPDPDIHSSGWMSLDDIHALSDSHRSPLVMQSLQDYLQGCHYPLDLLSDLSG